MTVLKPLQVSVGIEWRVITAQLFHYITDVFHYDTMNSQSLIRIENKPIRSLMWSNQLFE